MEWRGNSQNLSFGNPKIPEDIFPIEMFDFLFL